MKRPNINNYPIVKDGVHQYYHNDIEKYINYLEAKINDGNCVCTPDETTGTTTIACCNICGKPTESWWRCDNKKTENK